MEELLNKYKKEMSEEDLLITLEDSNNINLKNTLDYISKKYNDDIVIIKNSLEYEKLKLLFFKTRFASFPCIDFFKELPMDLAEKFKLKTYNMFSDSHLFSNSKALINMIAIFGLFEKDKYVNDRVNKLINIFFNQRIYCQRDDVKNIDGIVEKQHILYLLDENVRDFVPNDIKPYINDDVTPEYYSFLRKLRGNFGKKLNDFLVPCLIDKNGKYVYKKSVIENKEYFDYIKIKNEIGKTYYPYSKDIDSYYDIDKNVSLTKRKQLLQIFKEYELTYGPSDTLTMFVNVEPKLDLDFYNYFINHQADIVNSTNSFSKFSFVQKNYHDALKYYQEKGNDDPDYVTIIEWLRAVPYDVNFGDENFASVAKNAGVLKEGYEYYLQLLQTVKKRHIRVLPNHRGIYIIKGKDGKEYTIETKILNGSDPLNMLIGESKYTDCCQKYDDIGRQCLEHASKSLMGGILTVNLIVDGISKPLSQSWVWINEQELVLDNVEQTLFLKKSLSSQREVYEDLIADSLRLTAQDIIINSNKSLNNYISSKMKELEQIDNLQSKKQILFKLKNMKERQSIKVVSIGSAYSDIIVKNYFEKQAKRPLYLPKDYPKDGYSDAKIRYIAAGSEDEINIDPSHDYIEVPIYREERQIIKSSLNDASNELIKKLIDIDNSVSPTTIKIHSKADFINMYNLIGENAIICGEDWYCIYNILDGNINVLRYSIGAPRLDDEFYSQALEISNIITENSINDNKEYILRLEKTK